jgi:hypothetical protein
MKNVLKHIYKPFIVLTFFAIAMGFLESAVVYYIRKLYYPEGFGFPLKILPTDIIAVEWMREIATIIMLVTVAILAGRNFMQRFASFLYIFGVWDIFYYIWLKIMLDWPATLFDWDILFLIPITWLGPVLAPVLLSITMIVFAAIIIRFEVHGYSVHLNKKEWSALILGACIVLFTFIWDYMKLILLNNVTTYEQARQLIADYVPTEYNWFLFVIGEVLMLAAIFLFYRRTKEHHKMLFITHRSH